MVIETYKNLSELPNGEQAIITKINGYGPFRKRLTEMGFVKGKNVKAIKNAPLQDPVEYELMGYNVSLRHNEAQLIEIIPLLENQDGIENPFEGTLNFDTQKKTLNPTKKQISVALVGNPNSGKTTLFNFASGSHEKVGNYAGVTIDAKEAKIKHNGFTLNLTDLPGTYSLSEYSTEELFVRKQLFENKPDIVVNVIDASNLERNLYLTTQLIDMNIKVIIALNMFDEMEKKGIKLKYKELGKMLGIPIIPTIAIDGNGITQLIEKIIEVYEDKDPIVRHIHINYGETLEGSIAKIQKQLRFNNQLKGNSSSRYLAISLLSNDRTSNASIKNLENYNSVIETVKTEIKYLEKEYNEKTETIFSDAKYGFIAGALRETCEGYTQITNNKKRNWDDLLTHKYLGFPVFIFFMWLMFQATFTIGSIPMDWIDAGVGYLGDLISAIMPEGTLRDLFVDGIIGGVGGVIIFLPNILILFFFISLMEDTGYMARVSFIMDKLMHKIGLHGKSFIPLLMGFGCNVPAIMATRTLDNRKDRIMTMLITPFMSCSARLPVYVLIISAFFHNYQGLILFSIYLIGIILAVLIALIMKKTVFAKQDVPFVMELPPYRIPTLKNTTKHMWFKGSQYLRKMGTIILTASILIWALSYYPRNVKYSANFDAQIATIEQNHDISETTKYELIADIELQKASEHQEKSYIGRMGKFVEPIIQPLGFDWKIGISLITGLAAKEIVVGSMGVLYHADSDADETSGKLIDKLQQQVHSSGPLIGQKVFTPLVAFGFMLFILIYFPCIAVIAAIKKESNWKWALFTMAYTTIIAWIVAFITYQTGSLIFNA